MEKLYLDRTEIPGNVALIVRKAEIIQTGATVYSMPVSVRQKEPEYQRFAEEYDIRFIFDDNTPNIDFYTVPQVDIFATDSYGGYFAAIGGFYDSEEPVYYIDSKRCCFFVAANMRELIDTAGHWRTVLREGVPVEYFASKAEAKLKYELFDGEALAEFRRQLPNREAE